MPWDKVLGAILGMQGGVHPALFLLTLGGLAWVLLEWRKCEAARRTEYTGLLLQANTHYEKRIEEQKQILIALERNIVSSAALTASIESRTKAINDLVQGFAALVQTQEASRERFRELGERLERRQEEALNTLRTIQNHRGRA
jgi:hypothetical protein